MLSILVLFLLSFVKALPPKEKFLISLAPDHREWMTAAQVLALQARKAHFIDITDGSWDAVQDKASPKLAPVYPTQPQNVDLVKGIISKINGTDYKAFLDVFSAFNNRYYTSNTGVQSAQFLFDELIKVQQSITRTDITLTVTKFTHTWAQFSVIARLSPAVRQTNETVILGAHQDSINSSNPSSGRAPGYDDDGTGCANNLETLKRLIAEPSFVPYRPIEFQFYAGEERGLLGSKKVVERYVSDKVQVYAMLQSDMTGYPTSNPVYAVVTDYTNPALTSVLKTIGKTYTSLPVAETRCGYGCSDHAAYHNAGFPAAFHFETRFDDDNKKIHTAGDVFSVISLQHALEFVKSTIGFAVELSTFKTQ